MAVSDKEIQMVDLEMDKEDSVIQI